MNMHRSEKGFVFPLAIGVGLIVIFLGMMVLEQSHQGRIIAIAQKDNDRSLAAAEAGVAQFQSLFARYRALATSCSQVTCSGSVPWKTALNKDIDPCSATPNDPATLVQNYAKRAWTNVSDSPGDGQYRLMSYKYIPASVSPPKPPEGELIVEGRLHQNPDGSSSASTPTTRLQANFRVSDQPGISSPPGLWIGANADSGASSSVQINANLRDSTCFNPAPPLPPKVTELKDRLQPNFVYQSTPGDRLPSLPNEGNSPIPAKTPGVYPSPVIVDTLQLPKDTQTADGNILAYNIEADSGQSIRLTDNKTLRVGTGSETVVLYLNGGITISGNSKIELAQGSKLVIYAHGPVTLTGTATTPAIQQLATTPSSANVKLFVYTPSDVNLSGNSPLYLFVLAPNSKVISSAKVEGSIWSKSWIGTDAAAIHQDIETTTDLGLRTSWPIKILPITAWQQCVAPFPSERESDLPTCSRS